MESTTESDLAVREAAARLRQAAETKEPCQPVRDLLGTSDITRAYAVQRLLTDLAVRQGRQRVGRKIGLTSVAVQQQLGVDQPDFGVLFGDMAVESAGCVDIERLLQPRIEAEIAFILGRDLLATDTTADDVLDATESILPALEIVDSRVAGWDIRLTDTIADNASSGLFVTGTPMRPRRTTDFRAISMTMERNGTTVSSGRGADCLGNPLEACAWLARTSVLNGDPLRAGEVILSGALGPISPVAAGDIITARFDLLGPVSVQFTNLGS